VVPVERARVICAFMQVMFAHFANWLAQKRIVPCSPRRHKRHRPHTQPKGISMNRFEGKTVLVTGGTSGIGLATAQRLVREGARVIVTGSRAASIERAKGVVRGGAPYLMNDARDPAPA